MLDHRPVSPLDCTPVSALGVGWGEVGGGGERELGWGRVESESPRLRSSVSSLDCRAVSPLEYRLVSSLDCECRVGTITLQSQWKASS